MNSTLNLPARSARRPAPRRLPLCAAVAAACLSIWAPHPVAAATFTWDGNGRSDNWSFVDTRLGLDFGNTNWTALAKLPGNGDSLVFAGGRRLTPINDLGNLSLAGISFAEGAGAYTLAGMAFTSTGSIVNLSQQLQTLNLPITLGADQTWDGGSAGLQFNGAVDLRQHALSLVNQSLVNNAALDLTLGASGAASLSLASGSQWTAASARLGTAAAGSSSAGSGTVTVTGAGALLQVYNSLLVGDAGTGRLVVEAGGVVHSQLATIGSASGSEGSVVLRGAGSLLTVDDDWLVVGTGGHGLLNIEAGARLVSAGLLIGQYGAGSGSVWVTGAGTRLTSNGAVVVGASGSGALYIFDGGTVTSMLSNLVFDKSRNQIGGGQGSLGVVVVDGAGSTWQTNRRIEIGSAGSGSLSITNGGAAFADSASMGSGSGGVGTVSVQGQGSSWTVAGQVDVGAAGQGSLSVTNAGQASMGGLTIDGQLMPFEAGQAVHSLAAGALAAATPQGSVTVGGAGALLSIDGALVVGSAGLGKITVVNGAALRSASALIGQFSGSDGYVTIEGAQSVWTLGLAPVVGRGGKGRLDIVDGGRLVVDDNGSGALIGVDAGSQGDVQVANGGRWTGNAALRVGQAGSGTLTIQGDAQVASGGGILGEYAGGSGRVLVAGAGASWVNSADIAVGNAGAGVLEIYSGGVLSNRSAWIGRETGGAGSATVAGDAAVWLNTGDLFVGDAGTGTLSIGGGGRVQATRLRLGDLGTLNLQGGTLAVQRFERAGDGQLNWSAGTLHVGGDLALGALSPADSVLLHAGQRLQVDGTLPVESWQTLQLQDASQVALGRLSLLGRLQVAAGSSFSADRIDLDGGTLGGDGGLVNSGTFIGHGRVEGSGGFVNAGDLQQAGGRLVLTNSGDNQNLGNWDLSRSDWLTLDGATLANQGLLQLQGGRVNGSGKLVNSINGTLAGDGQIDAGFSNLGNLVLGKGQTRITQAFDNRGLIQLGAEQAQLAGGLLENSGQIEGFGQVGNAVINSGTVQALGGTLTLSGGLRNLASGVLTAGSGARLLLRGGLDGSNGGRIELAGGTFDNDGHGLVNGSTGTISGYGTLRSGGLTQDGQLQLSGGAAVPTLIYGNLLANAGSKTILSGSSNATFHGTVDVQSGAELRVSSGSVATFFGQVQQRTGALFTGSGAKHFEGGLSVGASPGLGTDQGQVEFGSGNVYLAEIGGTSACSLLCGTDDGIKNSSHDKYIVGGQLSLGGQLKLVSWNGFVAQAGQQFDLLDWGTLTGSFAGIDASGLTLAAGTTLDVSQLYTTGTISVTAVPEPHSLALLLAGLLGTGSIVRRRTGAV